MGKLLIGDMEKIRFDSAWIRGWEDSKIRLGSPQFWAAEILMGGYLGIEYDPLLAIAGVIILGMTVIVAATVTAPIRQRNDLRSSMTQLLSDEGQDDPKLVGEIEQIVTGAADETGKFGVLINMNISNKGKPSIADKYSVCVEIAGKRYNLRQYILTKNISLSGDLEITPADYIAEKTMLSPISPGARIRGWLYVRPLFEDDEVITEETLNKEGNLIEICFSDINGKETLLQGTFTGTFSDGKILYLAGSVSHGHR